MKKLINVGISSELNEYETTLVRNANISAIVLAAIALVSTLLFYFNKMENPGFMLVFVVPAAFTYFLNAVQNTKLARIVFIVLTALLICVAHAYFVRPGEPVIMYFFLAQFLTFLMIAVLFDSREKILGGIAIVLLLAIFLSFPFFNALLDSPREAALLRSELTNKLFIGVDFAIALFIAIHVQIKKLKSEKALVARAQQLEDQNAALEQQEKELQNTFEEISETHKEDDKRNWISGGVNQLNNILRNSDDKDLYRKLLNNIIKYLHINQGGLYEVKTNDYEEKFLVRKVTYGYEKERMIDEEIPVQNAGLLSEAFKEAAPVYRVEVPETYNIESGLGKTRPGSIFVVPLIYENNIEGILELAALRKLEAHEKEYILRAAGMLARFIESYRVTIHSKDLLERTNQQTEEMRAQEEEMRQNMEELQATQEELHRKEREYVARIRELEQRLGRA